MSMNPYVNTSYRCVACNMFFNNFDEQKQHYFINHQSQTGRNIQTYNKPFSPSFIPNDTFIRSGSDTNNSNPNLTKLTAGKSNGFNPKRIWNRKRSSTGVVPVKCEVCDIECTSQATYDGHIKGKRHIKNLNKTQQPSPITEDSTVKPDESTYNCEICDVRCCGKDPMNMHLKGVKHQKKVKLMKFEELKAAKDPSVYCEICDLYLQEDMMTSHKEGGKHKRKHPGKVENTPQKKMKMVQPSVQTTLTYCGFCHQNLTSEEEAIEHYQSSRHSSNLQNRTKDFELWCDLCQTSFHNKEMLQKHLNGFKHYVKANKGNKNPEGELSVKLINQRKKMQLLKFKKKASSNGDENSTNTSQVDSNSVCGGDTKMDTVQ